MTLVKSKTHCDADTLVLNLMPCRPINLKIKENLEVLKKWLKTWRFPLFACPPFACKRTKFIKPAVMLKRHIYQ